jgi:hypothetical protein
MRYVGDDGEKATEINFNISSMATTGMLRYNTAFHSAQLSGVIANSV